MPKAPFVAMLTDLCKEERVSVVADIGGYSRDEALGKLFRMWAWCTDRGLEDAPADCEGYAVGDAVVRRFLGPRGVEALLGDGCDDLALGARRPDGLIYLRGTSETVARLRKLRATAGAGGSARRDAERDEHGRFVVENTNGPAGRPADHHPESSNAPASSTVYPQTTDHRPQIGDQRVCGQPHTGDLFPVVDGDPTAPDTPPTHSAPRPRKRRSRLPEDWQPDDRERRQAEKSRIDCDALAVKFKRHYTASGHVLLNWDAKFADWIENEATRAPLQRAGPGTRNPALQRLHDEIAELEAAKEADDGRFAR